MKLLLTFISLLVCSAIYSQIKIGDNPQNIDANSVLELESSNRALVISRMNDAQMNALTPLQGALVFNTDTGCIHFFDGSVWLNLCETFGLSFTADPIVNPASTIVITQNDDNYNFEVGEIRGDNIVDFSISAIDIQNNSLTADKLAPDSVGNEELRDNSVTDAEIDYNQVTIADFTNDAGYITSASIVSTDGGNSIVAGSDNGAFYDDTPLQNDIAQNAADIASNATNIASNASDISTISLVDLGDGTYNFTDGAGNTTNIADTSISTLSDPGDGTYTYTDETGANETIDTRAVSNPFDPTVSGLTATNVQDAIDELNVGSSDNQNLTGTFNPGTNLLQIDIDNGTSALVDLTVLDDTGTDDQNISGSVLVGTDLTIGIETGTSETINLSSLVNDPDFDPTNEYNLSLGMNAGSIELTDSGGILPTNLISSDANNDITAGSDGSLYLNVASVTIAETETNIIEAPSGFYTYTNELGVPQPIDTRALSNPYDNTSSGLIATDVQTAIDEIAGVSTDDQNLSLVTNTLSIEDGNSVDLSGYLDNTDDQNLTLAANTLSIEDGNNVDLSPYLDNTDDQQLDDTNTSFNTGTGTLTITLEDGGTATADLSGLQGQNTDDQNLSLVTNTLSIEDGNSVDLSGYLDNTDDQNLTLAANTLSIEDGNNVDLSPYLDNTDDQQLDDTNTSFNTGTGTLTITLEDGGTATADLSGLQGQNTDDQNLSLVTNTLSIEDGNSVDLSGYLDNTDDQNLTLAANTLSIEDGNNVDLSPYLDNTDDQQLDDTNTSFNTGTGTLTITLEDGGTATADLSGLQGQNTDDQNLSLVTNTLSIEDGNSVDLSGYLDNTDDQNLTLAANTLSIEDGNNVDLSPYLDNTNLSTTNLTQVGGNRTYNLANQELYFTGSGNIGIGTTAPTSRLHLTGSLSTSISNTIGATTLNIDDHTIILGGNHIITLPAANTALGRGYIIKNPFVSTPGISSYIDNTGTNVTTIPANSVLWLQSDGINWQQIN